MVGTNEQVEQMTGTLMKTYEEMSNITNETMNAAMQSAAVLTKGYEEIFTNIADMMKTSFENNMAASKAIWSSKSVTDAMTAQSQAIKSNADYLMNQTNKLSELSSRLAQDVITPISNQVNSAMNLASKCSCNKAA